MVLATAHPALAADVSAELLQKGLFEEEANHNLESAIKVYQSVLQQTDEQRKVGATALFRLGECYRKLGQTNGAVVHYQRLVREFPEQDGLVKSSRRILTELGVEPELQMADSTGRRNAEAEELAQIQKIFRDSPDLKQTQTRLDQAVTNGWVQVAEFLLAHHADVNARQYNRTPLEAAASSGHNSVVKLLLSRGADVNATNSAGYTALHVAVDSGYQAVVETLVSAQANVNAATRDGWTALHFAALKGDRMIAEILIQHKADPNVRGTAPVGGNLPAGMTPLCVAALVNSPAVAELFCRSGAQVDAASEYRRTPLHYAANSGASEIIKSLLEHKANINLQDHLGWTPLHVIVYRLAAAADDYRMQAGQIQPGIAPELLASLNILLAHKAEVNIRNNQEFTPLNFFGKPAKPTGSGQEQVIALLKEHGAIEDVSDLPPDANVIRVWHEGFGKDYALWATSSTHQNSFTLLETIWSYYLNYPVVPGDRVPPRAHSGVPSGAGLIPRTDRSAGPLPELLFYTGAKLVRPATIKVRGHVPDLSRITVHRLMADKTYRKIKVNILNGAAIDCSKDMNLEFGDVIAIPEKETGEEAPAIGRQGALQLQMKECATRRVKLITPGKTNELTLGPGAGRYFSQAFSTFEARLALAAAGNTTASKFKITRRNQGTGKSEEVVLDIESFGNASKRLCEDLLLEDGDTIEVMDAKHH